MFAAASSGFLFSRSGEDDDDDLLWLIIIIIIIIIILIITIIIIYVPGEEPRQSATIVNFSSIPSANKAILLASLGLRMPLNCYCGFAKKIIIIND